MGGREVVWQIEEVLGRTGDARRCCRGEEDGGFGGGGQKSVKFQGACHSPHRAHAAPTLRGLSNVPGSTLQAQMSLDVQIGALSPWSSSLPLSLPLSHPRPARKPSRVARRDSRDRTGWAPRPPDDRLLQKMKHCVPAGDSARPGPGPPLGGSTHTGTRGRPEPYFISASATS